MAIKRIVSTSFWTDSKVDSMLSSEDKYFFVYLLTNPFTTQLGIYELPIKQAAVHLGWTSENMLVLLDRFEKKYGLIKYSQKTGEVAIKNYLRHSIVKGGKPVLDCLEKECGRVKDPELIQYVCQNLNQHYDSLNATVREFVSKHLHTGGDYGRDNKGKVVDYNEKYSQYQHELFG